MSAMDFYPLQFSPKRRCNFLRFYLQLSVFLFCTKQDASAEYIKNKAFDDQYYKDLIINYLRQYGRAQKKDFRTLLMDKLPNSLSERQKEYKIGNLLASLKRQGLIRTDSSNQQLSFWILE